MLESAKGPGQTTRNIAAMLDTEANKTVLKDLATASVHECLGTKPKGDSAAAGGSM
jgi:hypothetical protein